MDCYVQFMIGQKYSILFRSNNVTTVVWENYRSCFLTFYKIICIIQLFVFIFGEAQKTFSTYTSPHNFCFLKFCFVTMSLAFLMVDIKFYHLKPLGFCVFSRNLEIFVLWTALLQGLNFLHSSTVFTEGLYSPKSDCEF